MISKRRIESRNLAKSNVSAQVNEESKPPTTIRIFDRNDYFSVHGQDATTAAREVFSSISNIKKMGVEPNKQDYLVLSKGNFEILVRKLLLEQMIYFYTTVTRCCAEFKREKTSTKNNPRSGRPTTVVTVEMVKRYRVEIYIADGTTRNKEWVLKYKGSPGYLSQLEEVLGDGLGTNEDATATCLMAVTIKADPLTKGRLLGVACVASGEYQLSLAEFTDDDLLTELEALTVQLAPAECLIPQSEQDDYKAVKKVMERANITVTKCKKADFSTEGIIQDLNRLLKFKDDQQKDANVFPETRMEVAMCSLTGAIKYLELLSYNSNFGRYRIATIEAECFLHVDAAAMSALNVFPELGDTSNAPSRSIYGLLDRCRTAHGKRLLAQWLRQPLRDVNLINERLDIVEVMIKKSQIRLQLHEDHLRRIPDLQALARRLNRKKANLQDCYRIYQAIKRLPALLRCLAETDDSTVHSSLTEPISELNDDLGKFLEMIETTIDMEAIERGDFLVKASFDEQLESLSERLNELQSTAERELNRAARELNLEAGKSIKLESNPQNGFFFRITMKEEQSLRGNKKFTIIDAVKGGVRFQNNALVSTNDEYLQCKTTYEKEQDKVVAEIVSVAAGYSECLFCLSHILSKLDVLISYAIAACSAPNPYCRPEVVESIEEFILEQARHPCLELQEGVSYIANDVIFKRGKCIMHIVTGANMGGKSTWMRSAGAIVLLAHAGCPVPCARAVVPRLKAICARVGASDREQCGQSTFMMEMLESAAILRVQKASPDSLVLVDELGRGTSTYEGCGLAWAIAEELALKCRCFCCFATHYHELTRLPLAHPGVIVNSHAEAAVVNGDLVLLHRVIPGPAAHSLGLHVAKLADLPLSVLQYAESTQAILETNLFDQTSNNEDTAGGQKIVVEFLQQCKQIENTPSDEELLKKVQALKENLSQYNNAYVSRLLAAIRS
ncbi:DNA mismatch repair protein Msh2 [Eumeta japonica]|uniref:DNA mismatch repair protein Msh2 n=1 Tax=Eumeta variegata TaxID=151549 RepID=A0A4C1W4X2_EUMVA|nr:DNA mismatch repair protein Msh2 [Eumeta japonica]